MGDVLLLIVLALPFVLIYLFAIRPAKLRNQQAQELAATLVVGERVMTTSGLYGTVVELDEVSAYLEVSPGVIVRFARPAVGRRLDQPSAEEGSPEQD